MANADASDKFWPALLWQPNHKVGNFCQLNLPISHLQTDVLLCCSTWQDACLFTYDRTVKLNKPFVP